MGKRRVRPGDTTPIPAYVPAVVAWLSKKRLDVPAPLSKSLERGVLPEPALADEMAWVLSMLPALKERERRSLIRHVERPPKPSTDVAHDDSPLVEGPTAVTSDSEPEEAVSSPAPAAMLDWPATVIYSNNYVWDQAIPSDVRIKYGPSRPAASPPGNALLGHAQQTLPKPRRRRSSTCPRVEVRRIEDERHPAFGQFGLFARVALPRGARVIDYVGRVSLGEHEDRKSDYVAEFGNEGELALDANTLGNEARFINDFRNTGRRQNVEFKLRRASDGELRQGVFVTSKEGICPGDELLISYGKPFWRARVGDLAAFITRLPGQ